MAILNLTRLLRTPAEHEDVDQSEAPSPADGPTDAVSRLLQMLDPDLPTVHETLSTAVAGHERRPSDEDPSGPPSDSSEQEAAAIALVLPEEPVTPSETAPATIETEVLATAASAHERTRADVEHRLTSALDAARSEAEARRALEQQLARVTDDSERRLHRLEGEFAAALETVHTEAALRRGAETSLARLVEAGGAACCRARTWAGQKGRERAL